MMNRRQRIVADTNALISRLLLPGSTPARAVHRAVDEGALLFSKGTLEELTGVLNRPKFDRYVSIEDRRQFLRLLGGVSEVVAVKAPITICRDPRDNKFLETAFDGNASIIITGDRDLLILDPFREIRILSPAGFLGFRW
jgi:uncharacterized protein